jgi:hypothetical protein
MTTERLRPLGGVTARRMVVVFLVATFVLTWLMFLPVIVGLADRFAALGGSLEVLSSTGSGTRILGHVPAAEYTS